MVGRRVEVLTEGPSKKDRSRTTTRTRTNKIVHVPGELSAGTFVDVVIRDGHPHHLEGILA
ncbi:MAG: TRAM domain-containing protein [Actinobacteria bacterium]|nr:MAG: TRAM domain-containing protein [Actinomycetota bacterium]